MPQALPSVPRRLQAFPGVRQAPSGAPRSSLATLRGSARRSQALPGASPALPRALTHSQGAPRRSEALPRRSSGAIRRSEALPGVPRRLRRRLRALHAVALCSLASPECSPECPREARDWLPRRHLNARRRACERRAPGIVAYGEANSRACAARFARVHKRMRAAQAAAACSRQL